MPHLPYCILFVACLEVMLKPFALHAQDKNTLNSYTTIKPLEFLVEGQAAGSLNFKLQDSRGFIWGADANYQPIRFDGQQIEIFEHNPKDTTSASPGKLFGGSSKYFEDSKGKIWILYSTVRHLDYYNPVSGSFHEFHNRLAVASNSENFFGVKDVFEDHEGYIWIGTEKGLFRYDEVTDSIRYFKMPGEIPTVTLVFEDADSNIWVHLLFDGLARINRETGSIEEKVPFTKVFKQNWGAWVKDHHLQLKNKRIHLLVIRGQLFEFDAGKRNLIPIKNYPLNNDESINAVWGNNEKILLTTSSGLLLQYHPNNQTFSQHPFFFSSEEGLKSQYSQPGLIFQSNDGIIWAQVYQPDAKSVKNLQLFPSSEITLSTTPVPEELKALKLLVSGSDYLFLLNGEAYYFTHPWLTPVFPKDYYEKKINLSLPGVKNHWEWNYQFETATNGHLWQVATMTYSTPYLIIREFDENGNLIKSFVRTQQKDDGYAEGSVRDIKFDQNGKLWIGTGFGGLCRFDPYDNSFIDFSGELGMDKIVVFSILVDRQNNVWFGGNFGLRKFDQKSGTWVKFSQNITEQYGNVISLFEDHTGRIWVCTLYGLFALEKNQVVLKQYCKSDGFYDVGAQNIIEDKHKQLWLTGNTRIYLYDRIRDKFKFFGIEEGISTSGFSLGYSACKMDKHGTIIIPTNLTDISYYFNPTKITLQPHLPKVYFTNLRLFNEEVKVSVDGILQKALDFTEKIRFEYWQNDFTIHFTAPEYLHPEKLEFFVRMKGFNDEWQNLGNKREIRYTNLSPGDYAFQVKVRNHHGFWSDTPRSLKIVVLPPWYRTWWAYCLWAAIISGSIYWFYGFQLNRRLAEAEALRLQELDAAKTRLYTNITHEFRTPLTVILGMAEQVKNDPKNWFNEGLQLIRRNGKQLLNLVNQLLDLSKLESGHMPLNLVQGDIVNYLKYLTESFHSYADSKDIRLHFRSDFPELQMDHDPEKLQHVVSNLLSNAIKFTPAGGDVYVDLRLMADDFRLEGAIENRQSSIVIQVSDTGPGIAPEHLPRIFDRFYQADDTHTRRGEGSGIGLALAKELVKVMGGSIGAESELGRGTKFSIRLPIVRTAPVASVGKAQETNEDLLATVILEAEKMEEVQAIETNDHFTVLLVEDNPDVITYLSSVLNLHYRIVTARNGQEGIDKALELTPDVIVSDVMMPGKDGFELCQELKTDERTSHIPIVLLTAKADQKSKIEGLTFGADAYLAKPFHREELLVRLEKLIELRRRMQERFLTVGSLRQVLETPSQSVDDLFLQKTIRIIEAEMSDENFGMPQLCKALHMDRTNLFRKLKALTGKSATHLIRSVRLEKAKILLQTTDLSVSEVCYEVGFNNPNYFSTVFKEEFGVPPSEFRS